MKLKWTVEYSVDESWVADGFNLTNERALEMLASDLAFADYSELEAKVISAPAPAEIRRIQGS